MGANTSPLAAEIFMNSLENILFFSPNYSNIISKFIFWRRYVDDIFVFSGSRDEAINCLSSLNTLHPSINFTIEIENDKKSIPFLDLLITRNSEKIEFEIYRKPSATDNVINFKSFHPIGHKMAFFHSAFHRLFNIPLSEASFEKEKSIIFQIAKNNNFPFNIINKLFIRNFNKHNFNFSITSSQPETDPVRFPITFIGFPSLELSKTLRTIEIKTCYMRPSFNTKNCLSKTKDQSNFLSNSGVYKLNCGSCNSVYISQTGRSLAVRLKEHLRSINDNKLPTDVLSPSAFAQHIRSSSHSFDPEKDTKLLHHCSKGRKLSSLEILEIKRCQFDKNIISLNEQVSFSTPVIDTVLRMKRRCHSTS